MQSLFDRGLQGVGHLLDRIDPALDADAIAASHPIFESVGADAVSAVLAGLAAYYVDAARRPEVPRLPTLRSYHAKQAAATVGWLKARLA